MGCGSAGAVVARRLAEDKKVNILILEAGKQGSSLLNIPSMGLLLQKTLYDWQYVTVPQSSSCFALNNNVSRKQNENNELIYEKLCRQVTGPWGKLSEVPPC